ncbi:MAG: hypothetical protein AB1749_15700 [Pseudomonadota bacterium]
MTPLIDNVLVLGCAFAVGETAMLLVRGGGPLVATVNAGWRRIAIAAAVGIAVGTGLGLAGVKVLQ